MRSMFIGVLSGFLIVACGAAEPGEPGSGQALEPTAQTEQAVGPGGSCFTDCTPAADCALSCTINAAQPVTTTCGQFGTCRPPCNYQPVTAPQLCAIDVDAHIWGVRLEKTTETLYRAAGQSYCPDKWMQTIIDRADCLAAFTQGAVVNCCLNNYGSACALLQSRCH